MRVGFPGSGLMGSKLGRVLARTGHGVIVSNTRGQDKVERLGRGAGGNAGAGRPGEEAEAASAGRWFESSRSQPQAKERGGPCEPPRCLPAFRLLLILVVVQIDDVGLEILFQSMRSIGTADA